MPWGLQDGCLQGPSCGCCGESLPKAHGGCWRPSTHSQPWHPALGAAAPHCRGGDVCSPLPFPGAQAVGGTLTITLRNREHDARFPGHHGQLSVPRGCCPPPGSDAHPGCSVLWPWALGSGPGGGGEVQEAGGGGPAKTAEAALRAAAHWSQAQQIAQARRAAGPSTSVTRKLPRVGGPPPGSQASPAGTWHLQQAGLLSRAPAPPGKPGVCSPWLRRAPRSAEAFSPGQGAVL